MDRWIRYGLAAAWAGFVLAMLLWWWRRRYSTRRYSYSERATVIHDAMRQSADLGVVYWSKSEKGFLRRVITPLEMEGYTLKAFDHSAGDIRIFKVTRLKTVEVVPRGSNKLPSRLSASGAVWSLIGLGVAAVALLAVALYRGRGPSDTVDTIPRAMVTNDVASEAGKGSGGTNSSSPAEVVDLTPLPTPKVSKAAQEQWALVVYDHPTYDTNFVITTLQRVLGSSPQEAAEFTRKIRAEGRASVWSGKWTQAEVLRQTLEAEDIVAKVETASTTNAPAK